MEPDVPAKPQNTFERQAAELGSTRGLHAEVGKAEGETTTGVRLRCVPGKEHMIVQELRYKKKTLLLVLRRGQRMDW